MLERFTAQARETILRAREERRRLRHPHIGTEHLLLAMLSEDAGIAYAVLHEAGVDAETVREEVRRLVGPGSAGLGDEDAAALRTIGIDLDAVLARIEESFGPEALDPPPPTPPGRGLLGRRRRSPGRLTPRAKKVLELALREALRLKHNYIGTEHVLLGLLREGDGLAAKILADAGLDLAELRRATEARLPHAA